MLDKAKLIVASCLKDPLLSIYSHENRELDNELRFNCYGFIGHLLNQFAKDSYQSIFDFMIDNQSIIPISIDNKPCPFHFASFFSSLSMKEDKHWISVSGPKELQPGDFISYLPIGFVPKAVTTIQKGRTHTHVMMVEEVTLVSNELIELWIIDCTREPHCSEDTRTTGGIGLSPLTIHLSDTYTIIQWGTNSQRLKKELSFGRLRT